MCFRREGSGQDGSIALVVVLRVGTEAFIPVTSLGTIATGDGVAYKLDLSFPLPEGWKDLTLLFEDEPHEARHAHVGFRALGQ